MAYAFSKGQEVPDLAIEVIHTSGSINKLDLFRGLGVKEVWFWIKDQWVGYVLENEQYIAIDTSVVLPGLRLDRLTPFVRQEDRFEAVQTFRKTLSSS